MRTLSLPNDSARSGDGVESWRCGLDRNFRSADGWCNVIFLWKRRAAVQVARANAPALQAAATRGRVMVLVLALLIFTPALLAQVSGTLTGTVTDQSGGIVSGA